MLCNLCFLVFGRIYSTKMMMFIIVVLAVNAVMCLAQVQNVAVLKPFVDPVTIDPCLPKPTPDHPFISWDGSLLDTEWWEYVRQARNFPSKYSRQSTTQVCKRPWEPKPDQRRYYWEIACPYTVNWLSKFTWRMKNDQFTETCYVLFPCLQQIRIVNCTTENCLYRCQTTNPHVRNSVCLENNFRQYSKVLVFCPQTYKPIRNQWVGVDCRKYPHWCLKKITLSVPQCCECWSCWDMWVTMPELAREDALRGKK